MLYVLYNPDGSIHQANKVFDTTVATDYDKQLIDMGHQFCKVNHNGLISPDHYYVDQTDKLPTERPLMNIEVSKTRVICGDKDSALFTGIPKDASARILSSDIEIYPSFKLDATELEISIPVPCIYQVEITLWPYKTFMANIEGVAS